MTERKMRHMGRGELMEIVKVLQKRGEDLDRQISELETQLSARARSSENIGSLTDAAAMITEMFQAAQEQADEYLRRARNQKTAPADGEQESV